MNAAYLVSKGKGKKHKLQGLLVRKAMLAGEPVTKKKLVDREAGGILAAIIAPGKVAVSFPINAQSGVSGFIAPEDRVDIVFSGKVKSKSGSGSYYFSETIMKNIKVLAVDQTLSKTSDKPISGKILTLEVTGEEAEAIKTAQAGGNGPLTFVLRSLVAGSSSKNRRPFVTQEDTSKFLSRTNWLRNTTRVYRGTSKADVSSNWQ